MYNWLSLNVFIVSQGKTLLVYKTETRPMQNYLANNCVPIYQSLFVIRAVYVRMEMVMENCVGGLSPLYNITMVKSNRFIKIFLDQRASIPKGVV